MNYYYANEKSLPVGPYTADQMRRLHQQGTLHDNSWVIVEGSTEWKSYGSLFPPQAAGPSPVQPAPAARVAQPVQAAAPGYPMPAPQPAPVAPTISKGRRTAALVTGIVGCVFAAVGALWSFLGGACCGWAAWPEAGLGIVLAIVSLCLRRSALGWVALGLGIFSFVWVIIFYVFLAGTMATALGGLSGGL